MDCLVFLVAMILFGVMMRIIYGLSRPGTGTPADDEELDILAVLDDLAHSDY